MADAEATRAARKTAVGDERDLFAHPLPVERGGGRQHLTHTGATLGAFVTDHDHRTFGDLAILDRLERLFLAIEHPCRAFEAQPLHARDLHDRAVGRQRAAQPDNAASRRSEEHTSELQSLMRNPYA